MTGGHGNEIKAAYSEQPSFGRAMTRKGRTMKFKFAGESKLYGYYEFIKELDKHPEENRQ